MKKGIHFHVFGLVQGVFFRQSTQDMARRLGISGWVRNCEEGSVEGEAEGEEVALKEFTAWCHQGPVKAIVKKVEMKEIPLKNFSSFEIRR